jgi:hypothetical protein
MRVREATCDDGPRILDLFMKTPIQSGTTFVLDRGPDFGALPRTRGDCRTFIAFQGGQVAGTVTALWRRARDAGGTKMIGEIMDLRVAPWARGGRAAFQLLRAVHEEFIARKVDWILCLIGKHNHLCAAITGGKGGFPSLEPLEDFASVHFIALRHFARDHGIRVREATDSDAAVLDTLFEQQEALERFAPPAQTAWRDPAGRDRAWIASSPDGAPLGALVAWDGEALRKLRIVRYRAADLPLRAAIGVTAWLGMSQSLPDPGEVLRLWGTRLVVVRAGGARTLKALLRAALASGVSEGRNVLQVNLRARDPLLAQLPRYPRSIHWTTLYGGPLDERNPISHADGERFHADVARA